MGVAFITGAARGIGAATVQAFGDAGWRVIATDTAAACAGRPELAACDVTDSAAVDRAVADAFSAGAVAFVNVAGVLCKKDVADVTDDDVRDTFAVNVGGVVAVCRAVARHVREHGAPENCSVTTVASNAALVPRAGVATYAASKAAASAFTRSAGLELGPAGVRCNVVNPGSTVTPMLTAMFGPERDDLTNAEREQLINGNPAAFKGGIPLKRVGEAADVAQAVVFLASPAAAQITLAQLTVDGGASLL